MPPVTTPTPTAPPNVAPGSSVSTITDKVTGNSYSRDTNVPGSTYQLVPKAPATPAIPATPQNPGGASTEDTVAQNLGYKSYADAVSQLTAAPTQDETDLYNSAYQAAGLDTLQSQITSRQNDLATAQNNIDDNPWLDEADRVGRNKTVTDLANADIKNDQDEYNTGLKQVEDLVTRETADNTATATSNKAKLAALEAQAKQTLTDQKNASAAPKTVKGASGATYTWNPTTKQFQQALPGKNAVPSGPSGKPTSNAISSIQGIMTQVAGPDGKISPVDWQNALNEWMAAGNSESTFISNFKSYANVADKTQHYAGLN